ncbi:MAG TPA: hypothetical protein VLJ68_14205, partial [Chitinophagaceae bacterium]|nr:hypothetical protein [Chitinophagaceae bacterium]
MKKIIIFLSLAMVMQQVIAQTETFSIATYTPPKNWTKGGNTDVVTYTDFNTTTGAFCILAMYASSASLGDAEKDFKSEWMNKVSTPHGAEADPKTESETTPDGWKAVSASSPIKVQNLDAYAILTVFSGFGKKFSMLITLNDQSYINGIDALMHAMKLDKKATVTVATPVTQELSNSGGSQYQFGKVMYHPPNGWNVTRYPDGDILSPADLPKGEFLEVWIHEPMNFSGTIEEALQKSYDETIVKLPAQPMREVNGGSYTKQAAKT